jgi:hypothetical protein
MRSAVRARLPLLFALALCGARAADEAAANDATGGGSALAHYEQQARALVDRIEGGAPLAEIRREAEALMAESRGILGDFAVRYPPCGPYFRAVFGLADELDTISLEDLERGYHQDGRLPKAPAFCYHAKDFYVHPATVVVLVRENGERDRMSAEIREALTHVAIVRAMLTAGGTGLAPPDGPH